MQRIAPLARISSGLVALTCSLLLAGDLIGLVPAREDELIESRLRLSETLGSQAVAAAVFDAGGRYRMVADPELGLGRRSGRRPPLERCQGFPRSPGVGQDRIDEFDDLGLQANFKRASKSVRRR